MYILLTHISNVTFNPQLVLFDRLPYILTPLRFKSSIIGNSTIPERRHQ